jgi:hypothetical protein
MNIDDVREFRDKAKKVIGDELIRFTRAELAKDIYNMKTQHNRPGRCPPAVGIHPHNGSFSLAIRVRSKYDLPEKAREQLASIACKAGDVLDIREVGNINFLYNPASPQASGGGFSPHPVLQVGDSIGQATGNCRGSKNDEELYILSNSHVIAYPSSSPGAIIIHDNSPIITEVGELFEVEAPKANRFNIMDAAIAKVRNSDLIIKDHISGIGKIEGIRNIFESCLSKSVKKTGYSTNTTVGTITAFDLDEVKIWSDDSLSFRFDEQIEVSSSELETFSSNGDSGSVIVDEEGFILGLLFAAAPSSRMSYANPIDSVFERFDLELPIT